jgi:alginate O-acetyltransferase complex protein AlgI
MSLNSPIYIVFLLSCLGILRCTKAEHRWIALLVFSFLFYASFESIHLIPLLLLTGWVTWRTGLAIGRSSGVSARRRRSLLFAAVAVNGVLLFGLKLYPVARKCVASATDGRAPWSVLPSVIVTVGISYYLLQALSYIVDIYTEEEEPETCFGRFMLYLAFFPKLIQGPIERADGFLVQISRLAGWPNYQQVRSAALVFLWGLFKKVVVADRLAPVADGIFSDIAGATAGDLLAGVYIYSFQLYYDFSGYTDMAIGSARLFGIELTPNFRNPYFASSIQDFWSRWHISFSRWILKYVFRPLQMVLRQSPMLGTTVSIVITFTFSGLWHGPRWGYIVWGLSHGLLLAAAFLFRRSSPGAQAGRGIWRRGIQVAKILVTYHLVCITWIFFRSETVSDAFMIIGKIGAGVVSALSLPETAIGSAPLARYAKIFLLVLLVEVVHVAGLERVIHKGLPKLPLPVRWAVYYSLILAVILFGAYEGKGFIYAQF